MRKFILAAVLLFALSISFGQLHPEEIVKGTMIGVTKELRSLPILPPGSEPKDDDAPAMRRPRHTIYNPNQISKDGAIQGPSVSSAPQQVSSPTLTFDGMTAAEACGCLPPDPNMCVGPNHVVQMVNLRHSVYNKSGVRLSGPTSFSTIAPGATNDGDPIVLYDQVADRWILMQFSNLGTANDRLIFCVSTTPDPAGTYNVYSFLTSNAFPDYPHVGIWTNSYIITADEYDNAGNNYLGKGFYAIDRNKMLAGSATSLLLRFKDPTDAGDLPASLEGLKMPDPSALPTFWTFEADELGAPTDRLAYRTLNLNFTTPSLSVLSAPTYLNTASFDPRYPTNWNLVEEKGTTAALDPIPDRMMSRIIYRRFDDHESVVMNHTVNVSGVNPVDASTMQTAVRWYELRRNNPASPWAIYQQSTYAPFGASNGSTGVNAWMSSIDMDKKGNIAMAYSRSSTTNYPDIYYAQRLATDPLNTLGAEQLFYGSSGSQTSGSGRWGDYAAMAADPAGDTLWFTAEYYGATSSQSWKTRIGKFVIAPVPTTATVHFRTEGTAANIADAKTLIPGSTCLHYKDYPINIDIDNAPTQPATITLQTSGNAVLGVDYDLIYTPPITLASGTLTKAITLRVYDNTQDRPDQYIYISYTINANGGNAAAATYNQVHQVTILGKKGVTLTDYSANTYGTSATVFTENFDAIATGLGTWTEQLVAGTANANHFIVGANGGTGFTNKSLYISNNSSAYTYSAATSASMTLRAVSPNINITGKGQVSVSFTYKCNGEGSGYDYGSFWYSADGGTTWNTDGSVFLMQTTAATKTIALPQNVENISNLKIAFQWQNDSSVQNQVPLGIDLITVTAKPIIFNTQIQSAQNVATAISFDFGPNQTTYFIDTTTKRIMASITNNSSFNFGCTKIFVDRSGTGAVAFNSNTTAEYLASKTFMVTPENVNPSASYTIRLYYTEAEIAGWEAATGNTRAGMKMVKVSGTANGVSTITPANQGSYTYVITPATAGTFGADGITYDATFTGFSGFGVGKPVDITLPVTLISFKGEHIKEGNQLTWVVTDQRNVKEYQLEFSTDGALFNSIATVAPKASTGSLLTYSNLHRNYVNGNNYYRLKITDVDGKVQYSAIVLINVKENRSLVVYPNPAKDVLMLNYQGSSTNLAVDILDASGKLVYRRTMVVSNALTIPVSGLAKGTYVLRVSDGEKIMNSTFVKE